MLVSDKSLRDQLSVDVLAEIEAFRADRSPNPAEKIPNNIGSIVVALYEMGAIVDEIASLVGIAQPTIYRKLKKCGVTLRRKSGPKGHMKRKRLATKVRRLHEEGFSYEYIGEFCRCSPNTIANILKGRGAYRDA